MSGEYLRKSGTDSNRIFGTFAFGAGCADSDGDATDRGNARTGRQAVRSWHTDPTGSPTARRQGSARYCARGEPRSRPSDAEVRRAPLHVEQRACRCRASDCTSAISATFDASRLRWNIDSPANSPLIADAVEAARQLALAIEHFDAVRPAEPVQPRVGGDELAGDPAVFARRIGAGAHHVGEAGIDADVEAPARSAASTASRGADRAARCRADRATTSRACPAAPSTSIGKMPLPIGVDQRRGLEIAADRNQIGVRPPVGRRKRPAALTDGLRRRRPVSHGAATTSGWPRTGSRRRARSAGAAGCDGSSSM